MSNLSRARLLKSQSGKSISPLSDARGSALRKRWPIFVGLAVVAVLVAAYVDGGEEPIHPIVQQVEWTDRAGDNL